MLNTNLTKNQEDKLHSKLMRRFTPCEGFKVEDYYGVLTMKYKKNNHYKIQLIYDYQNGHPKTSDSIDIPKKDNFFLALKVLEDRSLPERSAKEVDDLFDFSEPGVRSNVSKERQSDF